MIPSRAEPATSPRAELGGHRQWQVAAVTLLGLYLVVFGPGVLSSLRALAGPPPVAPTGGWDRLAALEADVFSVVVVVLVALRWLPRHAPDVTAGMGLARPPRGIFAGAAAASVAVVLASTWLGDRLVDALGLAQGVNAQVGRGAGGLLLGSAAGAAAGFTEEVVLLALASAVVARVCAGRQPRRLVPTTFVVLLVLVVLRWLPHAYYQWGSVFVLLWIPGAYLLFRRVGSVWPLVVGHVAYDVLAVVGHAYPVTASTVDAVLWLVAAAGVAAVVVAAVRATSHPTNPDVSRAAPG